MWIRPFENGTKPAPGDRYVINGRPFNGTGFGYDTFEATTPSGGGGQYQTAANNYQVQWKRAAATNSTTIDPTNESSWPFALTPNPINPMYRGFLKDRPMSASDVLLNFDGVDADEDWDIPDFNNMALAGMIVNPFTGHWEVRFPSFHRPDLVNYWMNLAGAGGNWLAMPVNLRRRIMLRPQPDFGPNVLGNVDDLDGDGKWTPATEPDFTGRYVGAFGGFDPVNGPWDVDNDQDGQPDSVWVDLGFPVQTSADGQLVKPLVAVLCLDLDGRLNMNAHGNPSHYRNGLPGVDAYIANSVSSPMVAPPSASTPTAQESYVMGGGAFTADAHYSLPTLTSSFTTTKTVALVEPLTTISSDDGKILSTSYTGLPFAGITPQINAIAHSLTFGSTTLNPIGVGSGFGVADINLGPVLESPYIHDDRSYGKKSYTPFRVNPYRFLLEGNWDGMPRSTTSFSGGQPNNSQRPPMPGRYGEPHILDMTATARQAAGFLHPPRAGLTGSTGATTLGDDNFPPAPAQSLFYQSQLPVLARGNATYESSGVPGSATLSGAYGSPADLSGRIITGLDFRGMPIFANSQPTTRPNTTASSMYNDAIDDPYELNLSRKAPRGTNMVMPGDPTPNTARMSPVDAPITPAELEVFLRPRDLDTVNNYDRLTYLMGGNKQGFTDMTRRLTSESWDLPCPNLQPTPEIRDALTLPQTGGPTGGGLGIPATNLSFGDLLRGKLAAVIKANQRSASPTDSGTLSPTQIAAITTSSANVSGAPGTNSFNLAALLDSSNTQPVAIVRAGALKWSGAVAPKVNARLLSPDLLMGLRMNLNRPVGNGFDDTAAGGGGGVNVVDEPKEALNGEQIWKNTALSVSTGNGINFDATWDGKFLTNTVNDSTCEVYGRQELAKHLYVLAMMMMDSGYTFPTVEALQDIPAGTAGVPNGMKVAQQRRIITAYRVAQWAINAVDFADRDAIMTPFEFDIYPFSIGDPYAAPLGTSAAPVWMPGGWDVDGVVTGGGAGDDNETFRGLVWGMEYPELLITETLAFHDKGVADTDDDNLRTGSTTPAKNARFTHQKNATGVDNDFDQVRIPQGSAFIELYCTGRQGSVEAAANAAISGSTSGYKTDPKLNYLPRELYDTTTTIDSPTKAGGAVGGLDLARTTAGGNGVWRLAISVPHMGYDAVPAQPTVRERLYCPQQVTGPGTVSPFRPSTTTLQPKSLDTITNANLNLDRLVYFSSTVTLPDATDPNVNVTYVPPAGGVATNTILPAGGYAVVGPARPTVTAGGMTFKNTTFVGWTDQFASVLGMTLGGAASATWNPQFFNMGWTAAGPNAPVSTQISTTGANPWICPIWSDATKSTDPAFTYPTVASPASSGVGQVKAPLLVPVAYQIAVATPPGFPRSLGLNISEPAKGYGSASFTSTVTSSPTINGIGALLTPYDTPFDQQAFTPAAPLNQSNIWQSGTVLDYRTVFLQRLADPTKDWDAQTNPYITVDWMPIDLTIYSGVATYVPTPTGGGATTKATSVSAHQAAEDYTKFPNGPAKSQWTGWTIPSPQGGTNTFQNYIRSTANSPGANASPILCFESRQRGPRVAEIIATAPAGATVALAGPIALQWQNATSIAAVATSSANIAGAFPPLTGTNGGALWATQPLPEASLWAAISDHPRVRFIEKPWGGTTYGFKHQVKGHSLGFINDSYGRMRDEQAEGATSVASQGVPYTPGRGSWLAVNEPTATTSLAVSTYSMPGASAATVDPTLLKDYIGSPQQPFPWLTWNNRPYANAMELMLVPSSSPGRFTTEFTYTTQTQWTDRYATTASSPINYGLSPFLKTYFGLSEPNQNNVYAPMPPIPWGTILPPYTPLPLQTGTVPSVAPSSSILPHLPWPPPSQQMVATKAASLNAFATNATNPITSTASFPFGHMMNLFSSSDVTAPYTTKPSSNLHRLFEFVHVPSRFSGNDDLLIGPVPAGSTVLNGGKVNGGITGTYFEAATAPNVSPLVPFTAPFNRLSRYREPGKININTLVDHLGTFAANIGGTITAVGDHPDMWRGITNGFPEPNWNIGNGNAAGYYFSSIFGGATPLVDGIQVGQYFRDLVSARSWWNPASPPPLSSPSNPNTSPANYPPRTAADFAMYMQPPLVGGLPNPVAYGNSTMFNATTPSFYRPFRSVRCERRAARSEDDDQRPAIGRQ